MFKFDRLLLSSFAIALLTSASSSSLYASAHDDVTTDGSSSSSSVASTKRPREEKARGKETSPGSQKKNKLDDSPSMPLGPISPKALITSRSVNFFPTASSSSSSTARHPDAWFVESFLDQNHQTTSNAPAISLELTSTKETDVQVPIIQSIEDQPISGTPQISSLTQAAANHARGFSFSESGNFKEAIECYKKALENPAWAGTDRATTLYNIARAYNQLKMFHMAAAPFKEELELTDNQGRLIRTGHDRADSLYHLGVIYLNLGNHTEAIAAFKEILSMKDGDDKWISNGPDRAVVFQNLGSSYFRSHQFAEAINAFTEVLEMKDEGNKNVWQGKDRRNTLNKLKRAQRNLEKARISLASSSAQNQDPRPLSSASPVLLSSDDVESEICALDSPAVAMETIPDNPISSIPPAQAPQMPQPEVTPSAQASKLYEDGLANLEKGLESVDQALASLNQAFALTENGMPVISSFKRGLILGALKNASDRLLKGTESAGQ